MPCCVWSSFNCLIDLSYERKSKLQILSIKKVTKKLNEMPSSKVATIAKIAVTT